MVHVAIIVDHLQREKNKYCMYCTARNIDISLHNVYVKKIRRNNARTVIRRAANKSSSGRNKNVMKNKERKMWLKRHSMTSYFL